MVRRRVGVQVVGVSQGVEGLGARHVAYALAGNVNLDLTRQPLGVNANGEAIYLKDIWPTQQEVAEVIGKAVRTELYRSSYQDVFKGDQKWIDIKVTGSEKFSWNEASTYVKNPPYFDGMGLEPGKISDPKGLKVLAVLGDSITTDHISPAGNIKKDGPAGKYLLEKGVPVSEFNSYGARRGNHEVMVRGTLNTNLKPGAAISAHRVTVAGCGTA